MHEDDVGFVLLAKAATTFSSSGVDADPPINSNLLID